MKFLKHLRIRQIATLFVGIVFVGVMMASPAAALDPQETQSATTDSPWYDICSGNGTPTDVGDWKTVGASMYGGKYDGKDWSPDNDKQGGGHDDTGVNNYDDGALGSGVPVGSKPDAPAQFAELDMGKALGKLDVHTKIEIKYKNKVIVAQRDDVGAGGADVKGKHRAVDLWWETAKLLKFTDGLDTVDVRVAQDQNQPATPLNGKPKDVDDTADTGAAGCCQNTGAAGNVALVGKDNPTKAYNYFVGTQHLTPAQASGIIGNLQQESGVNPKSVQKGGPGRGIAQWSAGGRWEELKKQEKGKDIYDLATQLDFIWYEMNNVSPWKLSLKGSKDSNYPSLSDIKGDSRDAAVQAGRSFGKLYEAFGISGSRDTYAGDWWQKHHKDSVSGADATDGTCSGGSGLCAGAPAGWVQNTNKVVDSACTEWGKKVVEDGAKDNCDKAGNITKYSKVGTGNSCGESWCGDFVAYNYKVAGHAFPGSSGVASVPRVISYFQSIGARRGASTDPKPGDVVTYDEEHEGLVVGVDTKEKVVTTIEGNTGPDSKKIDAVNTSGKEGVHMHHRHYPSGASVPAGGSSNGQSGWGDYDVLISKQKK